MDPRVSSFTHAQEGAVARGQLIAVGLLPHDVRRLLRRGDLTTISHGVYLTHSGTPTWRQRAWSAVLATSQFDDRGSPRGAALSHQSALHAARRTNTPPEDVVHVSVSESRSVTPPLGVQLHRCSHFEGNLQTNARPPRLTFDQSVIDAASQATPLDAVGILSQAISERRTTALRLRHVADSRARLRQRSWLLSVLADIQSGSHSVLEHGFVTNVLRPHALPVPRQQDREVTAIGLIYRDSAFRTWLVELDGRAHHASRVQHADDLDRDLIAATSGRPTLRLGWRQVFDTPCRTAAALSELLAEEGGLCGPQCALPETKRRIRATR